MVNVINPHDFGAVCGENQLNTEALQQALDTCAQEGGEVVLDAGLWLTGPLRLPSNVILRLQKGAILRAAQPELFRAAYIDSQPYMGEALLMAHNATNIKICGEGTIDGAGADWWADAAKLKQEIMAGQLENFKQRFPNIQPTNGMPRPWLVEFCACRNVKVTGVNLINPAMWALVIRHSQQVVIDHLTITADAGSPQTDGIDIISSQQVSVTHSKIAVGHDGIAIKSGLTSLQPLPDSANEDSLSALESGDCSSELENGACCDIVLQHNEISSGHGVAIGSETANPISNVSLEDMSFSNTDYGVRIKTDRDRGNLIGPINISRVKMDKVKIPVVVNCSYVDAACMSNLSTPLAEAAPCTTTPYIKEVIIQDLQATEAEHAALLSGLPESLAMFVVFENCDISSQYGIQARYVVGTLINLNLQISSGQRIVYGPKAMLKEAR